MQGFYNFNSNLALVGPNPSDSNHLGNVSCLRMVQSCSVDIKNGFIEAGGIGERRAFQKKNLAPQINISLSYLLGDGYNEDVLGFNVFTQMDKSSPDGVSDIFPSGQTSFTNSLGVGARMEKQRNLFNNKNFFIILDQDGGDASFQDDPSSFLVFGFGNCYITNYSLRCSLGSIPSAAVSMSSESYYLKQYESGMTLPAIDENGQDSAHTLVLDTESYATNREDWQDPLVETTGDYVVTPASPNSIAIEISGESIGFMKGDTSGDEKLQNFELNLDIPRAEIRKFGSKYVYDKIFSYPLAGSASVSMIIDDAKKTGDSRSFSGSQEFDITVNVKANCDLSLSKIQIKKANLVSQSFSQDIRGKAVWNANFSFEEGDCTDRFYQEFHEKEPSGIFMESFGGLPEENAISLNGQLNALLYGADDSFTTYLQLD